MIDCEAQQALTCKSKLLKSSLKLCRALSSTIPYRVLACWCAGLLRSLVKSMAQVVKVKVLSARGAGRREALVQVCIDAVLFY